MEVTQPPMAKVGSAPPRITPIHDHGMDYRLEAIVPHRRLDERESLHSPGPVSCPSQPLQAHPRRHRLPYYRKKRTRASEGLWKPSRCCFRQDRQSCVAAAKDHEEPDPATITIWTIGFSMDPTRFH
ncbi:hypothetical protein JAAARDRAFT_37802 [Jaapia argillacea MUCL 33604]|uniref:Uncharacterized protein n=1 Tax=Jaapia argillacea MUCL 33604 TaxID=933084 RepID=A0A067PK30_9AGAM|nr:hypothetical protein JAAARDRAFT_37802 [Jaapia argillacea MUCL 33604]